MYCLCRLFALTFATVERTRLRADKTPTDYRTRRALFRALPQRHCAPRGARETEGACGSLPRGGPGRPPRRGAWRGGAGAPPPPPGGGPPGGPRQSRAHGCAVILVSFTQYFRYMSHSPWRQAWQHMFTATGIPAICVGYVSMFTPSAVVSPPSPAGPMPILFISVSNSRSMSA